MEIESSNTELNSASGSEDAAMTETEADTERKVTDGECPSNTGPCPYEEGEKVLAFHSNYVYEAKVLKVEFRSNTWMFRVHYLGWKKSWDEWVEMPRLMKDTEANRHRQPVLTKRRDEEKNLNPGRALQMKSRSANVGRSRQRKNEFLHKKKNNLQVENFVNIHIPATLKKQLVDDCEFITQWGKLVKLPRTPNVDDILEKYCDFRSKKDGLKVQNCSLSLSAGCRRADSTGEFVKGLRCYFDKALPIMLLYKSEREQFEGSVTADVSPSTVYGAEHLLRLFVKLSELLVLAKIEEETVALLHQKFVDFLKFLQKHQSTFFLSKYHSAEDVETSANKQEEDYS